MRSLRGKTVDLTTAGAVKSISPHSHAFPALDGLRGVAITLVLLIHTARPLVPAVTPETNRVLKLLEPIWATGGSGVHLFFVLSAFLLFLPYARHLFAGAKQSGTMVFYWRRARRILPAYYVALVVVGLFFERDAVAANQPLAQVISHALLLHNYSHITMKGIDGPTWTMAVEAQFYVLLPLFAAMAQALLRRGPRWLLAGAVALLLVSPVAGVVNVTLQHAVPAYRPYLTALTTLQMLSTFGAGMICAGIYVLARQGEIRTETIGRVARLALFWGLGTYGTMLALTAADIHLERFDYYAFSLAMGLGYGGILLNVVLVDSPLRRALSRPGIRFLGDISFSVYLWHLPLLVLVLPVANRLPGYGPVIAMVAALFVLVLPVSLVSFLLVERPFMNKVLSKDQGRISSTAEAVPVKI